MSSTSMQTGMPALPLRTWEYEEIRAGRYVVRPAGCLGTCGWDNGKPWQARFVTGFTTARNLAAALSRREKELAAQPGGKAA